MGKFQMGSDPKASSTVMQRFGAASTGVSPAAAAMPAKAPAGKKAIPPAPPRGPKTK